MFTSYHKSKQLRYLAIWPDDYNPEASYPVIFMLHGFGANMTDLIFLAPAIGTSGYIYLCPNAPLSFNMGLGRVGYGWTPPRDQATLNDVEKAESLLSGFFDEMFQELKVTPGNAILLGFSQGGAMTYRCGLSRPNVFRGLVALSASAHNLEELSQKLPNNETSPYSPPTVDSTGRSLWKGHKLPRSS